MTPEVLLDTRGEPLKIVGYASLFDSPIKYRGEVLTFARDAFLPTLRYKSYYLILPA